MVGSWRGWLAAGVGGSRRDPETLPPERPPGRRPRFCGQHRLPQSRPLHPPGQKETWSRAVGRTPGALGLVHYSRTLLRLPGRSRSRPHSTHFTLHLAVDTLLLFTLTPLSKPAQKTLSLRPTRGRRTSWGHRGGGNSRGQGGPGQLGQAGSQGSFPCLSSQVRPLPDITRLLTDTAGI